MSGASNSDRAAARRAPEKSVPPAEPVHFESRELFAGRTEIRILHEAAIYRLRITATGKLILTK